MCFLQDGTGAAKFASAIKQRAKAQPLILFSGDVFNPSISKPNISQALICQYSVRVLILA